MNKIKTVFFSPTVNTKKSLDSMASAIDKNYESFDLTDYKNDIQYLLFNSDDFVIVGAPVYCGRIPEVAIKRFEKLKGDNTPCVVVVTYGNRDYDDALLELADFVKQRGFNLVGAAALVGRHTFGNIQVDRPNSEDFDKNVQFIKKVFAQKDNDIDIKVPGAYPYRGEGKGGMFIPLTDETCTNCGLCVKKCPVGAISEDCKTISSDCLSCFRCIRICPLKAKNMNIPEYNSFSVDFSEKLRQRKENVYFL